MIIQLGISGRLWTFRSRVLGIAPSRVSQSQNNTIHCLCYDKDEDAKTVDIHTEPKQKNPSMMGMRMYSSSLRGYRNVPNHFSNGKEEDVIFMLKQLIREHKDDALEDYSMQELQELVNQVVQCELYNDGDEDMTCDYLIPLSRACANQNCVDGAECTEQLLAHVLEQSLLFQLKKQQQETTELADLVYPSPILYQLCLEAWSSAISNTNTTMKNQKKEYAMRAQRVWELQWEEYHRYCNTSTTSTISPPPPPNVKSHGILLHVWAKVSTPTRAEYSLQQMMEYALASKNYTLVPDRTCFETVMYAWSSSGKRDSHFRIQQLIQQLQELSQHPQIPPTSLYTPSIQSYNYLLSTAPTPSHAESLLQQQILPTLNPNVKTYNILLQLYNTHNNDIRRMYQIITKLRKKHHPSNISTHQQPLPGIDIYCNDYNDDDPGDIHDSIVKSIVDNQVFPDIVTYNTLLSALAKVPDSNTAHELLQLLEKEDIVDPWSNIITYNTVLLAYSRQGLVDKAQDFFNHSIPEPNVISYATLLQAYCAANQSSSKNMNYGECAKAILQKMIEEDDMQPNQSCYQSVIQTYIQQNNPHEAQEILLQMNNNKHKQKSEYIFVNTFTLNSLLQCWSNRGDYQNAMKVLQYQLQQPQQKPNTSSYHLVLTACASSSKMKPKKSNRNDDENDAIIVGQSTLKLMKQHHTITQQAYFLMFKAIQLLRKQRQGEDDESKSDLVQYYFQQCCQDGFLNNSILKIIQTMLSSSQLKIILNDQYQKDETKEKLDFIQIIDENKITTQMFPKSWSRNGSKNVKQQDKRKKLYSK